MSDVKQTELSLPRYRGFIADSARWLGFEHRPGDIVISTPPKSGTTWMQMLVALVLFDGPGHFPAPVNRMSLWLDMHVRTREECEAVFEGQTHRRFIKTHVPLDGLPMRDDVTYVVVGRDPRDVWISMEHHGANMSHKDAEAIRLDTVGGDDLDEIERWDEPEDRGDRFRADIDRKRHANHCACHLAWVLHHLQTGWERRHAPNVHLFHYADLQADLPGQIVRVGQALGIDVPQARAVDHAAKASLTAMREQAAVAAPEGDSAIWKDVSKFFRSGGSGEWRDLLQSGDEEHYWERVAELVEPGLAAWAHEGGPVA